LKSVPAASFAEVLSGLRDRVEARLDAYLQLPPDCPDRLRQAMSYSLLGGGKRLRPILVLLSCEACGGDLDAALPAACAIEMIHTYSLIHDDLPAMDDDDLRRGRPTCHKQFDEATAVLAGDGLLTLAFEIVARDVHPPDVAAACCVDLANAAGVVGMVGGQAADLEAEEDFDFWISDFGFPEQQQVESKIQPPRALARARAEPKSKITLLESVHRRKTGRLLCSALTLGGRIAGADPQTLHRLQNYGIAVGLAFQIADDLLDVVGDAGKMGKSVRKDAGQGKLTYPSLLGEGESRRRAHALIGQACAELAEFGERGERLQSLARFVIERDR
jgi:geranylgeranyl diphosphate synthase type II